MNMYSSGITTLALQQRGHQPPVWLINLALLPRAGRRLAAPDPCRGPGAEHPEFCAAGAIS